MEELANGLGNEQLGSPEVTENGNDDNRNGIDSNVPENDNSDVPDEMAFLAIGLNIAGFKPQKLSMRTQERRFKEMFGCRPVVSRLIWIDLRGKVQSGVKIEHIFWTLFFLKKYPTEGDMAARLKKDPGTIRKWVWAIIYGLQELRAEKIRFPVDGSHLIFLLSVDGTDCRIEEPRPFSKTWFSQKFKGAAVKYEVALDVLDGHCVWINGPFRGSKNDVTIFRQGLKNAIPAGKLVIADKGYRGEPGLVSFPNDLDDPEVREFKKRVRARQETFNARLKAFGVLSGRFRHKPVLKQHEACFVACAVIVQYGIENGSPLFSV